MQQGACSKKIVLARVHGFRVEFGVLLGAKNSAVLWQELLEVPIPSHGIRRGPPGAAVPTLASSSIAQNSPPETVPLAAGSRKGAGWRGCC